MNNRKPKLRPGHPPQPSASVRPARAATGGPRPAGILGPLAPNNPPPGSENWPVAAMSADEEIAPMLAVFRQIPAAERRAILQKLLAELDPPPATG